MCNSHPVRLAGKCHGSLCPEDAIWTLDLVSNTWHQRHATGDLLPQAQTCALTVANGHGYALVTQEAPVTGFRIYELDLQSWQWRCVSGLYADFQLNVSGDTIATALVQVQGYSLHLQPSLLAFVFLASQCSWQVTLSHGMLRKHGTSALQC